MKYEAHRRDEDPEKRLCASKMFQIRFEHAASSKKRTEHYTSYAWLALGGVVVLSVDRTNNGTTSCLGPKTLQPWRGKYLLEERARRSDFPSLYLFWSGVCRRTSNTAVGLLIAGRSPVLSCTRNLDSDLPNLRVAYRRGVVFHSWLPVAYTTRHCGH